MPSQAAEFNKSASDLSAGLTLQAYSLASMPCGNFTRKTSMPCVLKPLRVALRRPFAGIVGVVSDADTLNLLQRFPKLIGKTFRAEQARHVRKPFA